MDGHVVVAAATPQQQQHTVHLRVTGMMCQKNCGTTVSNALRGLSGAVDAWATHATSSAGVTFDMNIGDTTATMISALEEEAIDIVECVGFDARLLQPGEDLEAQAVPELLLESPLTVEQEKEVDPFLMEPQQQQEHGGDVGAVFQVGGMSCAVCTGRVERTLANVEGVRSASVTLATHRAKVLLLEGHDDDDDERVVSECQAAVEQAGYTCDVLHTFGGANNSTTAYGGVSLADNAQRMQQARDSELNEWKSLFRTALLCTVP
eukprot:CAMPEP_0198283162 /NCGR_PEP_ID=MMETSP1449-20131203/2833_1 /TAXON_ID=420275 /ORGANISM="Attheya septentrionalis, Strain CCMP2084" /LENGTH=263 /DNA_ID=CAMNT_0043979687 /DNA_START=56 /DNA_END=844 /DNA_ORIENTATION=+